MIFSRSVVYLLSHGRPMFEVLKAVPKDIGPEFLRGFEGMTDVPIALDDSLQRGRAWGCVEPNAVEDASFLVSFPEGRTDSSFLDVPGAEGLPAVRWRQQNLDSLEANRRAALVAGLEDGCS